MPSSGAEAEMNVHAQLQTFSCLTTSNSFWIKWLNGNTASKFIKHDRQQLTDRLHMFVVDKDVSELEFNAPFQHKYGYIRDERSGMESYPYPVKEG